MLYNSPTKESSEKQVNCPCRLGTVLLIMKPIFLMSALLLLPFVGSAVASECTSSTLLSLQQQIKQCSDNSKTCNFNSVNPAVLNSLKELTARGELNPFSQKLIEFLLRFQNQRKTTRFNSIVYSFEENFLNAAETIQSGCGKWSVIDQATSAMIYKMKTAYTSNDDVYEAMSRGSPTEVFEEMKYEREFFISTIPATLYLINLLHAKTGQADALLKNTSIHALSSQRKDALYEIASLSTYDISENNVFFTQSERKDISFSKQLTIDSKEEFTSISTSTDELHLLAAALRAAQK